MKVDFSGDEIKIFDFDELEAYRIARKMEQDGLHYYSRMKKEALEPEILEVIEMLIEDERDHLRLFERRVEELALKHKVEDEGETLADIVDSKAMDILKDTTRVAEILCDSQEALRLGASVEKRSIAFYNEILRSTEDRTGKAAIEELIQQEQDHLEKLNKLLGR